MKNCDRYLETQNLLVYTYKDGRRGRGRPKETWRRTVEAEMKQQGWTWGYLERAAQDRNKWRDLVEALCAPEH